MQPDFEKSAAAMVAGTQKAIDAAVAPLLKRIEVLEQRQPEKGEKGDKGDPGESIKGETGVGLAGALIDRTGVLVLTLSDGTTRDLGVIVGKDGKDGVDGLSGEPGKDGKDGFSLDDFEEFVAEDDRTIVRRFKSGEYEYESRIKFPVQIYRGVFKEGTEYERGDTVTWGGCQWHCDEPTKTKPDSEHWTKCVNKGRDGKDAR